MPASRTAGRQTGRTTKPVRTIRTEDALAHLRRDHEQTQGLYEGFQTAGGDDRYFLASRIIRALEQHASLEEELFYPVILERANARNQGGAAEAVRAALKEHQEARRRITRIKDMLAHDEGYQVHLEDLMECVGRHVEEEEGQLFPLAKALLSDDELMQLGSDFRRMKPEGDARFAA